MTQSFPSTVHPSSTQHATPITLQVPGDKSLSHRAVMFSTLLPHSEIHIHGLLAGADVRSTLGVLQAMGLNILHATDDLSTLVLQCPEHLHEPSDVLDCGNSGTTMRLLSGLLPTLLRHQPHTTLTLTGDASLRSRPMKRVIAPLAGMGVPWIARTGNTKAPMTLLPEQHPHTLRQVNALKDYTLPVASAQVKSALLLAGLSASEPTTIIEPLVSRDHTETMLQALGVDLSIVPLDATQPLKGRRITLGASQADALHARSLKHPTTHTWHIPGDISSAAFHLVAASSLPEGYPALNLTHVNLNPQRTGILSVLARMGVLIDSKPDAPRCGEPCGTLHVIPSYARQHAEPARHCTITPEEVPSLVDELPILAVAASFMHGSLTVTGAEELRAKESDRIESTMAMLQAVGIQAQGTPDGFIVQGGNPEQYHTPNTMIHTYHDHRIAMSAMVLEKLVHAHQKGALATTVETPWDIEAPECVAVSYPGFKTDLARYI
ncbi:MAG: 3-phosphoshikimate 1-carboxyvinyltransferase [Vampirovibrionales bacterium]